MLFEITHRTDYRYGQPAREAYIEARLTPPVLPSQEILSHAIDFLPSTEVSTYHDYFGNQVTFYSMTLRHERLAIINKLTVRTKEIHSTSGALDVSVAEVTPAFCLKAHRSFRLSPADDSCSDRNSLDRLGEEVFYRRRSAWRGSGELNRAIHEKFRYEPGSTDISTPLETVWKQRAGVCQDFTHVMLGFFARREFLRAMCAAISSPILSGRRPAHRELVGSLATHAWVEVFTPGMRWLAIDPTNNQWCGQRHVTMAYGRDSVDATPLRGTFKGSGDQNMRVRVTMKRMA